MSLLKFDELSVINVMKSLYNDLDNDNRTTFLELAQMVYEDNDIGTDPDSITEYFILEILDEPNEITQYIYTNEVLRKREYAIEGINSANAKSKEFKRALKYWSKMTAQYALEVSDRAMLKAFKDAGVKKVMWNTQEDDRVCDECAERDGQIYSIDNVPRKVHYNDRCYFTPVFD